MDELKTRKSSEISRWSSSLNCDGCRGVLAFGFIYVFPWTIRTGHRTIFDANFPVFWIRSNEIVWNQFLFILLILLLIMTFLFSSSSSSFRTQSLFIPILTHLLYLEFCIKVKNVVLNKPQFRKWLVSKFCAKIYFFIIWPGPWHYHTQ